VDERERLIIAVRNQARAKEKGKAKIDHEANLLKGAERERVARAKEKKRGCA